MIRRREFLKLGLAAGASLYFPWGLNTTRALAQLPLPLDPFTLTKYVDPLPIPSVMPPAVSGGTHYEIAVTQFMQQLHSQLSPTTVWGYNGTYPARTIEATRGVPITVKWINSLTGVNHPLPVDPTLHWADPTGMGMPMPPFPAFPPGFSRAQSPVPLAFHLHGGETEPASDGHPDSWWTPGLTYTGPEFVKDTYFYHNGQHGTTLWYHDHALGITRLNVFMGLAGFYLLRDSAIEPLLNLPSGVYEIPVVIQDRMFYADGSLNYGSAGVNPDIHPYWQPEFFGDVILVNGKVWPYLNVEPRKYRFRLLNGSNARFYNLSLSTGQPFFQIGSDGGFLKATAQVIRLLLAPGERADVIVDFTGLPVGTQVLMTNDAAAPYPAGVPADPNTVGQIMKFVVVPLTVPDTSSLPAKPNPSFTKLRAGKAPIRSLTLNEVMGPLGPIMALLNNSTWDDPITEHPKLSTTEVWEIINLTGDTHPIHLHLVQFQVDSRQRFAVNKYVKDYMAGGMVALPVGPYLVGQPIVPDLNEQGWKDTVRMNPREVTRIVVRFANQDGGPYPFDATAREYAWHCHILEHEDNEMMRPYRVVP